MIVKCEYFAYIMVVIDVDTFFLESKIWYDGHESFNNNLSFLADRPHELLELMFEPRHLQKHTCPYVKKGQLKKN